MSAHEDVFVSVEIQGPDDIYVRVRELGGIGPGDGLDFLLTTQGARCMILRMQDALGWADAAARALIINDPEIAKEIKT